MPSQNSAIAAVRRAEALAYRALADAKEAEADALENAQSHDELVPIERAAAEVGTTRRVLRDAGTKGELALEGPRSARVVRRSALNEWLKAKGPRPKRAKAIAVDAANDTRDEHADDQAAFERSAARLARSG